jgi:hypothetical protein
MNPISVTNIHRVGDKFSCDVVWNELQDMGAVSFVADENDNTEHGRALYAAIARGDYGPIGDELPPSEEALANTAKMVGREVARQALKDSLPLTTLPQVIKRLELIETMLGLK